MNEKGVHAIREEIASIIEKVVKDYPTETMLIQHLKWASQAANRATTDGMLRCLVELSRARALMGCPADDGVNIRVQIEDVLRMDYLWIFVATHGVRAFLIDKQLASPIDEAAGSDK